MNNKEYIDLVNQGKFPEDINVPLDSPFIDERGIIQNLWLGNCGSVTLITSKAGSIRANHVHHDDWHGVYILSGEIKYSYGDPEGEVIGRNYKTGEMIFSPPEVWHKVEFLVDTTIITFNGIIKNHENYEKSIERSK